MTSGLRERKKLATRARIADVALDLFLEQGFDETTVAQVAAAAEVSAKTVFNYFPAKEDLFFDQAGQIERHWLAAVADRAPGESPLAGLRRRVLSRFDGDPGRISPRFLQVMAASAQLQARRQQMVDGHEDAIAAALSGQGVDDTTARVLAHQVLGIQRMAVRMTEVWRQQDAGPEEVRQRARKLVSRAFDILDHGLAAG